MSFDLPDNFISAIRERRLLPFIGAGFSKNISPTFPSWYEVIRHAAHLLDYDPDILLTQGDYLQIAEYLGINRRLGELYNQLSRELDSSSYDVGASRPHLLLPYLDVQSIFTTNWDTWLERAYEHEGIPFTKVVTHHDFVSPRAYRPRPGSTASPIFPSSLLPQIRQQHPHTAIVKFHGDFSSHKSIVFREADYYNRLDFEHPLDIRLRSEVVGRSVLFVGYSFSDQNVRYLWYKINKVMQLVDPAERVPSFFVTHTSNPLQMDLLRRRNIETILLHPLQIATDLARLFETIIEVQRR